MNVKKAIENRRAYRSLEPVKITKDLINNLAECAQITASCFNNQPWQFIFVYEKDILEKMHNVFSSGNEWAKKASMIITVLGKKEDDCVIHDRIYYRFDIGMATEAMILQATDMGLVAHPIAGYSPKKTHEVLGIPDDINVIALIIVNKKSDKINPSLNDKQINAKKQRTERKKIKEFVFHNYYRRETNDKN
jgi:nitroreductase